MQTGMQPLPTALAKWADVQAVIGETTLLVRDAQLLPRGWNHRQDERRGARGYSQRLFFS
jgi:hypothetical protein